MPALSESRRGRRAPLPSGPEGVPAWLERCFGVQQLDQVIGLAEACRAAEEYSYTRGALELRAQAFTAQLAAVAVVKYRQALEADLASTKPLTPRERTERLTRFLLELRRVNRWQLADVAPPAGANLPPRALLAIAWHLGYRRAAPNRNSVRDLKRLLVRRSLSWS